ncbi:hypothetical protein LCGC14_1095050 [marine sediment metagenome]|uniref:Uncharacterized protein n=1 Tax=marine sediment metagenome TaxID=412755 RepID=A0A0F9MYZ3_9ZZZZ
MAVVRRLIATLGLKVDKKGFRSAEKSIDGVVRGVRALGTLLVTGAVAAGFKSLIDLASESAEATNKFGAVFEDATDRVQKQIDEISGRTGQANLQLTQFAGNIGALVKPALGSAEAAGDLSSKVAELAFDISSFNDVEPEQALIALRSGLIGSAEPLQRFGVDVRVAALEQEALRQGLTQSVKEMTEGQRVSLRFAAIMRQLGSQGALGDATRTARQFANASRALRGRVKELGAQIGTFLLPFAEKATLSLFDTVKQIQEWIKVNKELIQQRVSDTIDKIGRVLSSLGSAVVSVTTAFVDLIEAGGPVGGMFARIALAAAVVAAILLLPGGSILLLIALIGLLIEDFETWQSGGESVIGALVDSLKGLEAEFSNVSVAVLAIGQTFADIFGFMTNLSSSFIVFFIDLFTVGSKKAMTAFSQNITQSFNDLFGEDSVIGGILDALIGGLIETLGFVVSVIGEILSSAVTQIGQLLTGDIFGAFTTLKNTVVDIFDLADKTAGRLERRVFDVGRRAGIGQDTTAEDEETARILKFRLRAPVAFGALGRPGGAATAGIVPGAVAPSAGAAITDNSTNTNQFNVTQRAGENGEDFARRVAELQQRIREDRDAELRNANESFLLTAPAT